jgi:hypothetical protein
MPLDPVVAVWVVVFPLGVLSVKVTLAPGADVPPFVTEAAMATVPGGVKLAPETETVAATVGGVITVALAVPDALEDPFAALRLTAYVPAGVPEGAPLSSVTAPDCPGPSVSDDVESDVDQPEGSLEPTSIVLDGHPEESLFVMETE